MSGFFDQVYEIVRQIPRGKVASYGQIAAILEHPRAGRTVGWALHSLPDDLHIPWHRVVSSSGGISTTGFADPPDLQRRLLEAEGIQFDVQGRVDMRRFGWDDEATRHRLDAPTAHGPEDAPDEP
jgi:methylated-DNA-protein-cysteine methyltransferase related protein